MNKLLFLLCLRHVFSPSLQNSFPNMKGLSYRNLNDIRKFAETYLDFSIVQQLVAQLTWGKIYGYGYKKRTWYALKFNENGWSRNIIAMQIEFLSKRNS